MVRHKINSYDVIHVTQALHRLGIGGFCGYTGVQLTYNDSSFLSVQPSLARLTRPQNDSLFCSTLAHTLCCCLLISGHLYPQPSRSISRSINQWDSLHSHITFDFHLMPGYARAEPLRTRRKRVLRESMRVFTYSGEKPTKIERPRLFRLTEAGKSSYILHIRPSYLKSSSF